MTFTLYHDFTGSHVRKKYGYKVFATFGYNNGRIIYPIVAFIVTTIFVANKNTITKFEEGK